ncbi:ABC transporter permease [Clostridium aestuarii]|uniref:ABC transporter permease n=1 Tax=Clostridium aestuarii TaxID=338193 RepID=A0ABT4D642_9CLOT|nr:ABC transporter permease [Clostridium aestuarii]MCY6485650.1 ABC transporter permease [Clostridium aestuarii]
MKYLVTHWERVIKLFIEHSILTFLSLFIALCIAIPLGIVVSRNKKAAVITTNFFGVIYTIPGLALLSFLVPFFGLGAKSALITLAAYAQMILVRNTITSITTIKPEIIEAARGMGMNKLQLALKVQFPLAIPIIVAGIRIATISIINLAFIAAFINGGGLGELVLEGIRTNNSGKIISGTIALGVLMVLTELIFRIIEHFISLKPRK